MPAPRRRKRANWPYRFAWLGLLSALGLYISVQTVVAAMTFGRRSYGIDWGLAFVASCLDATIAIWFVAVGASIGSFLNVVAYRLPLGRHIGGHSSCPYCQTPIEGYDNVPILAWIKLRGRCRACRLPISAQYPLVELSVAIVFLSVYLTEVACNGANLPLPRSDVMGRGVLRVAVTPQVIMRLLAYLFLLASLIGAALIAVRRRRIPLRLYAWAIAPLAGFAMLSPEILVVAWREVPPLGPLEYRLDALATLLCGAVTGMAVARLLIPLAYPGSDRSLMSGDAATTAARQFVGGMAAAGAMVGWQSVVTFAWIMLLSGLISVSLLRSFFRRQLRTPGVQRKLDIADPTIWLWLGLLVFRANWDTLLETQWLPSFLPTVARHVLAALLLAPAVVLFRRLATPTIVPTGEESHEPIEELATSPNGPPEGTDTGNSLASSELD